jgi:uridine kinase/SAM-dependent methyltransferase
MVVTILISGTSGSGKSTIAKKVSDSIIVDRRVTVIQQDDFFTTEFLPYHQRHDFSYENGWGIDWDKIVLKMEESSSSSSLSSSLSFRNNPINSNDENEDDAVIIVEGHMLGAAASRLLDAFDGQATIILVFLHCSKEICKARRLNRRNRSEQEWHELNTYIDTFVWPCFIEVGMPSMESLRNIASVGTRTARKVTILDLSTECSDSMDDNVKKITEAIIHQSQHDFRETDKEQPSQEQQQQEEIIEVWPSLAGDLHGFAQHEVLSITLDHSRQDTCSFELECVSSLSLLDMINLADGSHDATGHSVWMGAFLWIEALASDVAFGLEEKDVPVVLSLRSLFQSKRVLELGCGTGIGGLALLLSPESWKCRPSHISFSDSDEQVLALCETNCQRYFPSGLLSSSLSSLSSTEEPVFSTFTLQWGDASPPLPVPKLYDTVLSTDVVYDLACLRPLLASVLQCIVPRGFFVLAHVPRSCLPDTNDSERQECPHQDYHAILEDHIMTMASELGLQTCTILRPEHIRNARQSDNDLPLNSTSLVEMEEAGGAIFVFQRL